jgi:transcriptional regulator with XRE-family HTH domain
MFSIANPPGQGGSVLSDLGSRIRKLRSSRGWTLDQLAGESQLTKGYLSQVENGKAQPTGRVLLQIARALGASVDWLLTGNSEGEVVENTRPVEIPPELAKVAIEQGWSASKLVKLVGAHNDLLARRSDKARHATMTGREWLDFANRIGPYLEGDDGE